jgi:hypothetical protein
MMKVLLLAVVFALCSLAAWAQDEDAPEAAASDEALAEEYMPTIGAMEFTEIPAVDRRHSASIRAVRQTIERSQEDRGRCFPHTGGNMSVLRSRGPVDCGGVMFTSPWKVAYK